ncbi:hypothetical protein [Acidithiobacillus thiooxidans]|uniref:Uncharacterized protein n=1 Tax=Acidithiobacillus thiooxidans ATCC 19377 TaxID=637390 RepID=A0A543Q586_ACITH|nr:hypothetical protein [Acidithiobacillus thiooxidans]MDX5934398.1 hypothetical protein [Acidithiobacillus thiooxidans]TQN51487.1 hypothetical protein DLNHIDIE_01360 [Acidithiobacillus thiooxidans ATCC 19377]
MILINNIQRFTCVLKQIANGRREVYLTPLNNEKSMGFTKISNNMKNPSIIKEYECERSFINYEFYSLKVLKNINRFEDVGLNLYDMIMHGISSFFENITVHFLRMLQIGLNSTILAVKPIRQLDCSFKRPFWASIIEIIII